MLWGHRQPGPRFLEAHEWHRMAEATRPGLVFIATTSGSCLPLLSVLETSDIPRIKFPVGRMEASRNIELVTETKVWSLAHPNL